MVKTLLAGCTRKWTWELKMGDVVPTCEGDKTITGVHASVCGNMLIKFDEPIWSGLYHPLSEWYVR